MPPLGPVQPRRNAPLPPLDGPRGLQHAAALAASNVRAAAGLAADGSPHSSSPGSSLAAYPPVGSPLSSVRSSRLSAGSSIGPMDIPAGSSITGGAPGADPWSCSRSTSASSCQGAGRPAVPARPQTGDSSASTPDGCQAEAVVKAMLPVVKRGISSPNRAVFQTSLDSLIRIERMFGKKAVDQQLDVLAEAIDKQLPQPGGDTRASCVLRTLLALCTEEGAAKLRARFPQHTAP